MEIDTGDILAHARPKIKKAITPIQLVAKLLKSVLPSYLVEVMNLIKAGKNLNRVKQWKVSGARYYRASDFNEGSFLKYKLNGIYRMD